MNNTKTALASAICAVLGAGGVHAATFEVTSADDAGPGSLREAIALAGANAEADVLDLSAISGQTITLSTGALAIDADELVIDGNGVTVDADGSSGVIYAYDSDVTINDLTVTGGDAEEGGGIATKYGSLTLNDSVITGNSAVVGGGVAVLSYDGSVSINRTEVSGNSGGIYGGGVFAYTYYGAISVVDSVITGNDMSVVPPQPPPREFPAGLQARIDAFRSSVVEGGGGGIAAGAFLISEYSDVTVAGTTISNNSAETAGGMVVSSSVANTLIEDSTLSGNQATNFGGSGIFSAKYGDLTMRNSTISGNESGGIGGAGVFYAGGGGVEGGDGTVLIEFTTVTDNSADEQIGGLAISNSGTGTVSINASIVSGNTAPIDPDIGFEPGTTTEADVTFSLIGVDSTSGTLNFDAASTTLLGQDPLLGALQDNGGDTETHLPSEGSPLIDAIAAGSPPCDGSVSSDQRGVPRPSGDGCEIGSVELGDGPPIPEATAVPVLDRFGLLLMAGLLGLGGWIGMRRKARDSG